MKLDPQQLQELNPAAIAGVKEGPYGAEALVRRQQIPAQFVTEHTNLEDIILFLAKGRVPEAPRAGKEAVSMRALLYKDLVVHREKPSPVGVRPDWPACCPPGCRWRDAPPPGLWPDPAPPLFQQEAKEGWYQLVSQLPFAPGRWWARGTW